MVTRIIITLLLFSAALFAQSSTTLGNLIRIPLEATQIDPADTMGTWISYSDSYVSIHSSYIDVIRTIQNTYFAKYEDQDYVYTGLYTSLYLEDFNNETSNSFGGWMGYYDVPEPYVIYKTVPFKVENGTWLMNGVYNMSFISDNDEITILPWNNHLVYISGKINDKYLTIFRKDTSEPAYDFYMLDLSNSPDFDTTDAEKIFFDIPVAPYETIQLSNSLYIAGVDSLPYQGYGIYLFKLENNIFHYIKKFFNSYPGYWSYRNGSLYIYEYPDLVRYEYSTADTSFINQTLIVSGGGLTFNDDFTLTTQFSGDSLLIYDINTGQLINTIDISSLWDPRYPVIDSPYVYLHQTTLVTGVKEKPLHPVDYNLQVYPNPFNPATNIVYTLPERSRVEIRLFDILGREVRNMYSGEDGAGSHKLLLEASDLTSGIYFISLRSGNYLRTQKILLLK